MKVSAIKFFGFIGGINDMKFDVKDLQSQIDRLKGKEKR